MNHALVAGVLSFAAMAASPAFGGSPGSKVLPTVYEAGHFYATPETTNGQNLRLLVDTGGGGRYGMYWITTAAARRLLLKTRACKIGDSSVTVADVPEYQRGHGLPPPSGPCGNVVMVQNVPGTYAGISHDDGQFSGSYLYAKGVWTFDYPGQRLILQGNAWRPHPAAHPTPLGFQRDDQGHATFGYARITIRVDGQPLDLLLDTGATAHPTPAGEQASGAPVVNGSGVTSYITASVFDRWHRAHPDWRVVREGDELFGPRHPMPIIEVPEVEIAGWSVGPVWFTERPDPAFHDMMSCLMDKRIEGAVGGNVFRHFVMTIDYPQATAYFRCASGCKSAAKPRQVP
jgi:predicted aspartyl protease